MGFDSTLGEGQIHRQQIDQCKGRNGSRKTELQKIAPWGYADTVFRRYWDNGISTVKANQFGFTEMIDSYQMMQRIFDEFRAQLVLP